MLSKRVQYLAYAFFLAGFGLYLYSYFGNKWYKIDYSDELEHSFVEVKEYTEGLVSVCWFGDCASLGIVLPHKSLKAIYVARLLMLGAIWTLSLCLSITVYKLHFTPEWWKSKSLLTVLGGIEVFSGSVICATTFFYLFYHDLSTEVGTFQDGCYTAWLAGAMFVTFGLFSIVSMSSIILPVGQGTRPQYVLQSPAAPDNSKSPKRLSANTPTHSPNFPRLSKIQFS